MIDFNVPNLDGMSIQELEEYTTVFKSLMLYADYKAAAMTRRLNGEIQPALFCENECEKIYNSLPENMRW